MVKLVGEANGKKVYETPAALKSMKVSTDSVVEGYDFHVWRHVAEEHIRSYTSVLTVDCSADSDVWVLWGPEFGEERPLHALGAGARPR